MNLKEFFRKYPSVALGFSGGVDSSFLLWAALAYGADVTAYFVKTPFQPQFELHDAKRLADSLGARLKIIEVDILAVPQVAENPSNRCYYCKTAIFSAVKEAAVRDGYPVLLDGTNASDDAGDRPGMVALKELSVLSPLRLCGLTKEEVRRLSKEAGLFTWNKPAYACLATRIPTGQQITEDLLKKTEQAEEALFSLGFRDFRVRISGSSARIQIPEGQFPLLFQNHREILARLSPYFSAVTLDLKPREPSVLP